MCAGGGREERGEGEDPGVAVVDPAGAGAEGRLDGCEFPGLEDGIIFYERRRGGKRGWEFVDHAPAARGVFPYGFRLGGAGGGTDEGEAGVEGCARVEGVRGIVGDDVHHTCCCTNGSVNGS